MITLIVIPVAVKELLPALFYTALYAEAMTSSIRQLAGRQR
jgi:hypothetical protein